ncbi:MAG: NAD-dependent malic enzyme [Propionibacterium sp.]|nr:NAD-dependent malic enzyme [Propionibacterium sp.]
MMEQFEFGQDSDGEVVRIRARGREVLSLPMINRGTAFSYEDRIALGLRGLLPRHVNDMSDQLKKVYDQYRMQTTNLAKNLFLTSMQDRNEVLFYRLLAEHLEEMLPIIYTPTIGEAIQLFSHWMQRPRGVFLSIDAPEIMEEALLGYGHDADDVDLIVVTDSEGILGIGDQGVGGVRIAVGKLAVYTAAAGIHPQRALPVVLDTGTDNLQLLNDESYLGLRRARVRGEEYDEFVDQFVRTASKLFPHAMIHWEDFGAANAHRILDKYRNTHCTFNDDIQGTAAVVVAALLSAVEATGVPLTEQRFVIHGAGTAGIGIADLLCDLMVADGMSPEDARRQFWCLGSRGLIHSGLGDRIRPFQQPYARTGEDLQWWSLDRPGHYTLADVVHNVHPTVLIGTSAQAGTFTKAIVTDMASHTEQPVIFPLSNPTSNAEAVPADLLRWTDGRALIATGSPFGPVRMGEVTHQIAQANNALVFPGLGLGVTVSRATRVTQSMLSAAATAVAGVVSKLRRPGDSLLPEMQQLRMVSATVALAVAAQASADGVATRELTNPVQDVYAAMWQPTYPRVEAI